MAHALNGYDGLCKNIHGHTYHLSVTFLGEVLDDPESPENGLVVDFSTIKDIVKSRVIDDFDHTLVLMANSPISRGGNLEQFYERILYTEFQPSCENLLLEIKRKIEPVIPEKVELVRIRLDETPGSYAEWLKSDN